MPDGASQVLCRQRNGNGVLLVAINDGGDFAVLAQVASRARAILAFTLLGCQYQCLGHDHSRCRTSNKKENTNRAARVFPVGLSYKEELLFQPAIRVARGRKEKKGPGVRSQGSGVRSQESGVSGDRIAAVCVSRFSLFIDS